MATSTEKRALRFDPPVLQTPRNPGNATKEFMIIDSVIVDNFPVFDVCDTMQDKSTI